MDTLELIEDTVLGFGFSIIEEDDEHVEFRFQLNKIYAWKDAGDEHFVSFVLLNFADVSEDNYLEVLQRCDQLNREMKQVKLYVMDKSNLMASSEFYYRSEEDFAYFAKMALDGLVSAKKRYREMEQGVR